MTENPYIADHKLMADRDRLRKENQDLRDEIARLTAHPVVVARGIEALQNFEGRPGEWPGSIE